MALTKAEKEAGYKAIPQPNEIQIEVLRRAARGYLMVTHTPKGDVFTYDDGSPMRTLSKGGLNEGRAVNHMVACGWLIPIKGESLLNGEAETPQRWRARTVDDGLLPRFVKTG